MRLMNFTLGMAMALSLLGAGRTKAETLPITPGMVISQPGKYYLPADSYGPGITITASDVDVNLAGHTFSTFLWDEDNFEPAFYVRGASNVRIHDGTIYQQGECIVLEDATYCRIDHMQGLTSIVSAILVLGGGNHRIEYNSVGSIRGVQLSGSTNNLIRGNNIFANYGVLAYDLSNTVITGNTIHGDFGIRLHGGSNVTVRENTIEATNAIGLDSSNSKILHNWLSGDGWGGEFGMEVGGNGNRVEGNEVRSFYFGIVAFGSGATIQYNTALDNAIYDLADASDPPLPNLWQYNTFNTTNYPGLIH